MQQVDGFAGVTWDTAIPVTVTTLDRLIAQYGVPAFCKIDVEGYELALVRAVTAAAGALHRVRPWRRWT
ncbi:MAG: FkbM family methyltransferase [Caldilineaceae bacterium]